MSSLDKVNTRGSAARRGASIEHAHSGQEHVFSLANKYHSAPVLLWSDFTHSPPPLALSSAFSVRDFCFLFAHHPDVASCKGCLFNSGAGAEISPWGWKFHARLILGGQQAVPIVQGQSLKAMQGASTWAN